jgi:hypothetical protein
MKRYRFLVMSVMLASLVLTACAGAASANPAYPSNTQAPAAAPTSAPAGAQVPNMMDNGFPTVLAQQQITPGTATSIQAGPYTIQVPADAFTMPVTFTVLSADPTNFAGKVPAGEEPILAFAFMVKDAQGNLVGKFNNPVMFTAKDSRIVAGSMYYNVTPAGEISPNPTGLQVSNGKLSHPIAGAPVGWVITAPKSAASQP